MSILRKITDLHYFDMEMDRTIANKGMSRNLLPGKI